MSVFQKFDNAKKDTFYAVLEIHLNETETKNEEDKSYRISVYSAWQAEIVVSKIFVGASFKWHCPVFLMMTIFMQDNPTY